MNSLHQMLLEQLVENGFGWGSPVVYTTHKKYFTMDLSLLEQNTWGSVHDISTCNYFLNVTSETKAKVDQ